MPLRFILNGTPRTLTDIDPHQSVLSWLRAEGLTGAKEGCAEGECGACAIALLARDEHGTSHYEAVNSCLVPLGALDGQVVTSVEGVAAPDGALHPVQLALVEQAGSQCGYCTPGFVISLFCEYYRASRKEYDPEAISGNLCRCTGYRPIADAARSLSQPLASDPRLRVLAEPQAALCGVDFRGSEARFLRPSTLAELFEVWDLEPDATLIAGGTDLMVYRNQRYDRHKTLVSLEALAELSLLRISADELVIGAGVKLSSLEARLRHEHAGLLPAFQDLLPLFSSRLIRNRATLGGNLGTASPIGDSSPVLLALDAELTLMSRAGTRRLPLHEFFLGYRQTALAPKELILSVHVPLPAPKLQRFYKVSKRVLDDISAVAAAFTLTLDEARRIQRLRLAFGGIAATPIRALALERAAVGRRWSEDTVAWLSEQLESVGTPLSDQRASAAYRRAMAGRLIAKFFHDTTSLVGAAS